MEEILELVCLDEMTTDDVEHILLNELLFFRSEIHFRSTSYGHFNLDKISNESCRQLFRFEKRDLERLRLNLGIPDVIETAQRYRVTGRYLVVIYHKI